MPNKVLSTTFKADGNLADYMGSAGVASDKLRLKMKELSAEAAKSKGGGDEDGGGIASIRRQLGGRSSLGQLGSILTGGAAVGGVTLLSKALGDAADKARELKREFDDGKIGAGGVTAGIAESIPVLGTMIGAFDKLKNAMAAFHYSGSQASKVFQAMSPLLGKLLDYEIGEREYAEKIRQEELGRKALLEYQADALERQKKTMAELATLSRRNARERAGADLEGYEKERFERQSQNEQKLADLQAKRQQALEAADKDRAARAAEIGKADIDTFKKVEAQSALAKANADAKARINREYDAAERDQQATNDADSSAATHRHLQALAKMHAAYSKELTDTDAAANVERLRTNGQTLQADLMQVRQQADDKKRAIDQAMEEQLKGAGNPAERQRIQADADAAKASVDRAAGMAQQNAVYKELRDAQLQGLQAQAAAGDDVAASEVKRLQAAREYEAELLKLQAVQQAGSDAQKAEATADIARLNAARNASVANGLRTAELDILRDRAAGGDLQAAQDVRRLEQAEKVRQLEAQILALKKDGTPAQQQQADLALAALKTAGAEAVSKELRDNHLALLQQRAQYGATAAERMNAEKEIAAEQIKQQQAERQAKFQSIIDDERASGAQKEQARRDMMESAALAAKEYDRKMNGAEKRSSGLFQSEERGLLMTGVREGAMNTARFGGEGAQLTQQTNKHLETIITLLGKQGRAPSQRFTQSVFGK